MDEKEKQQLNGQPSEVQAEAEGTEQALPGEEQAGAEAGADATAEQIVAEPEAVLEEPEQPVQEPEVVEEGDPLQAALAEQKRLHERMLRLAADFDNFRKRSRREIEDSCRRSREELLRELLPVFDNLERAVAHSAHAADVAAVADGVKIVLRQFEDTAGKLGIKRVESVGAMFDPNVHEAIQQIETADQPAGAVVAEVLPGYVWGERLLRAAMVVVAKAPAVAVRAPDPVDGE